MIPSVLVLRCDNDLHRCFYTSPLFWKASWFSSCSHPIVIAKLEPVGFFAGYGSEYCQVQFGEKKVQPLKNRVMIYSFFADSSFNTDRFETMLEDLSSPRPLHDWDETLVGDDL